MASDDAGMSQPVQESISTLTDRLFQRFEVLDGVVDELVSRTVIIRHPVDSKPESPKGIANDYDVAMMNHLAALSVSLDRNITKLREVVDTLAL